MKKTLLLVPLFVTALAVPALLNSGVKNTVLKADALSVGEDGLIEINEDFFTNWEESKKVIDDDPEPTPDPEPNSLMFKKGQFRDPDPEPDPEPEKLPAGSFGDASTTFWGEGYSFNAMGSFFRGESNEKWTGNLISKSWTQSTQYVYFTWSAQNNSDNVYLKFCYGDKSAILKNDTFVENTMKLHHFKIDDEDYASFNGEPFEMHVELYDNSKSGFAFNNFGFLHVNRTKEQCSDAMRWYLNHLDTDRRDFPTNNRKLILNHYFSNAYLKDVFYEVVDNVNEDFEDNERFLKHWYLDYNYDNNDGTERHIDTVISNSEYRPDGETNMPFNKTGNGFFKGWYAEGSGYTATDGAVYRFVSRPFVLSGNGLISIKMAGHTASLHVINCGDTHEDLAWIDCRTFNPSGNVDIVATGFNSVTMVRHYINLERYIGKTIQLAIADVDNTGWGAAYFDELVTNYNSFTKFGVEEVTQNSGNAAGTTYAVYRDVYVNSTHIDNDPSGIKYVLGKESISEIDTGAIKEAYDFLNYYFDNFRTSASFYSFCEVDNEVIQELLLRYSKLSDAAKAIVDASSDYDRGTDRTGNWYEKRMNQEYTVGQIIDYISHRFGNTLPTDGLLVGFQNQTSAQFAIIVVLIVSVMASMFGIYIIIRKRKENK